MRLQDTERLRWRRGQPSSHEGTRYPLEQECSLEVPLGYVPRTLQVSPRIAVLLHAFHVDLLDEIRAYLEHIPYPADLFVSTDTAAKERTVAACFAGYTQGELETLIVPNRGRDVAPKLVGFAAVHDRYEYVLHLHTKRSAHDSRMAGWRGYLLETLLGSPATVRGVFEAFSRAPLLGVLAPQHIDDLRPWVRWNTNFEIAEAVAARMGLLLPRRAPLDFPSGSMFWARSAALRPLLDLRLDFADFPEESGQTDGTLAHAIERLFFLVCEQAGFEWVKITARGELHDQRGVTGVDTPEDLDRFLTRRSIRLTTMRGETRPVEDLPAFTTLPPRPRRVLHVLWRRALGNGVSIPTGMQLAVVLLAEDAHLAVSVHSALRRLPFGVVGEIVATPMPASDESDGAWRNRAMAAAFAGGADLVLLLEAPGLMHPDCAAALVSMSVAQGGRAMLEAARFPQPTPKAVDLDSLAVTWAGGHALAVPRAVFEATGGFDERLTGRYMMMDLSWRARALNFYVRHCPRALYLDTSFAVENREQLLASGLLLANKWGDTSASIRFTALLRDEVLPLPEPPLRSVPPEWLIYADWSGDPLLESGPPR